MARFEELMKDEIREEELDNVNGGIFLSLACVAGWTAINALGAYALHTAIEMKCR